MSLLRRMATVSGWTLGSRILGLVRDRMLAGAFGGSLLLDAFLLAFALPNLLRNLFGEGALSAAFLPRYVQLRDRDQAAAEDFAGLVLTRLSALLGLIAAAGMAIAGVVLLVAETGEASLVAALALPQLPYLLFICVSAILAGVLNGRRHFAVPAAAPVVLNLALIGCVWWWTDVWVLPYAVLAVGALQLAMHLLALAATGAVPKVRWRPTPELRELRRALLPVLIATGVYQFNALLDSVLAFVLVPGAGAVAYLFFANRLFQFPLALVGHGVGIAVSPDLASAAGAGWTAAVHSVRRAGLLVVGLTVPASVGLAAVAEPLAGAFFQHGRFDQVALDRTVLASVLFALGLVPVAVAKILIRVCHAGRDQRTPLRIGLSTVVINLIANLILVQTPLREAGLALASSLTAWLSCAAYLVVLTRRAGVAPIAARDLGPILIAACLMGAGVWALLAWWPADAHGSGLAHHGPRLVAAVALGVVLYAALVGRRLLRAWRTIRAP